MRRCVRDSLWGLRGTFILLEHSNIKGFSGSELAVASSNVHVQQPQEDDATGFSTEAPDVHGSFQNPSRPTCPLLRPSTDLMLSVFAIQLCTRRSVEGWEQASCEAGVAPSRSQPVTRVRSYYRPSMQFDAIDHHLEVSRGLHGGARTRMKAKCRAIDSRLHDISAC